jgi:hypothetical protein
MTIFGPVANAAHGGKINPWFSILIGVFVLIGVWPKYLRRELRKDNHIGVLLGISAICGVFVVTGLWELFH